MSTDDNQTKRLKIHHLTDRVIAMIAGDVNLHTELLEEVRATLRATEDQPEIQTVKNIADAYAKSYIDAKRRRAESAYLLPIGLTVETFIQNQRNLTEAIAADLTRQVVHFQMPACAALFVGIDQSAGYGRAHIYTVQNGEVSCHNDTGFAAIGVGRNQAASSLMFTGHGSSMSMDQVLYMTLVAKKRAEVAPGVGKETDMAFLSVAEGKYIYLKTKVVEHLEEIYAGAEISHTVVNQTAVEQCHEYLDTFRTTTIATEPTQRVELSGTAPTADTTGHFVDGSGENGASATPGV
ncbi:hypothetical protein [Acidovorax sp.]|uniref:hypothetical protein n=1 Tax=Acidovorax sp. TaxID=1872122 RepID=UPI00391B5C61